MQPYLITAKLMRPSNMKRFPTPVLGRHMWFHTHTNKTLCNNFLFLNQRIGETTSNQAASYGRFIVWSAESSSNVRPCSKTPWPPEHWKGADNFKSHNDSVLRNLQRTAPAQFHIHEFRGGKDPLAILIEAKATSVRVRMLNCTDMWGLLRFN
jgi:hypothetical protein